MKRFKRDRVKVEGAERERAGAAGAELDLAQYIHDRVQLMQQVFSALKPRDLRAMAPPAARALPLHQLQELCTEELLGISSKRLLAVLDGAEPPSDTESSASGSERAPAETLSLDSISSDDDLLSHHSKKKKHKHKRRDSKAKSKRRSRPCAEAERSPGGAAGEAARASRAGLTVLELLELQARARAIRAQLHNEHTHKSAASIGARPRESAGEREGDEDEVEIKEETPDVVEISSEDEKPDLLTLRHDTAARERPSPATPAQKPSPTNKHTSTEPANAAPDKQHADVTRPDKQAPQVIHTDEQTVSVVRTDLKSVTAPDDTRAAAQTDKPTITRRVSDLIITVPQTKTTRKIKLNRNNVTVKRTVPNVPIVDDTAPRLTVKRTVTVVEPNVTDKAKKKLKKSKKKNLEKEGSDHDEIMLQLSDSEKMDLLEDLNEKNYEKLSSSSEDSDSSSSDTDTEIRTASTTGDVAVNKSGASAIGDKVENAVAPENGAHDTGDSNKVEANVHTESVKKITESEEAIVENIGTKEVQREENVSVSVQIINYTSVPQNDENNEQTSNPIESQEPEASCANDGNDKRISNDEAEEPGPVTNNKSSEGEKESDKLQDFESDNVIEITKIEDIPVVNEETQTRDTEDRESAGKEIAQPAEDKRTNEKEISEGELSDRESSEVEAFEIEPEVVCISDEEKKTKKKKKKDKKSKKEKKSKKSSKKEDFRERANENFYRDIDKLAPVHVTTDNTAIDDSDGAIDITDDDDDVYEILELSDDSSCYEVEGTVLSKEPTAEEIQALSAAIDDIKVEDEHNDNREQRDNAQTIDDGHANTDNESEQETEYTSWKDRYLGSNKVKKVLTTANILNALRKKNKELKKKIQDAKMNEKEEKKAEEAEVAPEPEVPVEGSIEQFKTLQASTKYVDPVQELVMESTENKANEIGEGATKTSEGMDEAEISEGAKLTDTNEEVKTTTQTNEKVTKGMKKDAKQLLKMYKKLLKYNDMDKQRDPNRKERKESKKKKKKQSADGDTPRP